MTMPPVDPPPGGGDPNTSGGPPPDQHANPDTITQRALDSLSRRAVGWIWRRLGLRKRDRL